MVGAWIEAQLEVLAGLQQGVDELHRVLGMHIVVDHAVHDESLAREVLSGGGKVGAFVPGFIL